MTPVDEHHRLRGRAPMAFDRGVREATCDESPGGYERGNSHRSNGASPVITKILHTSVAITQYVVGGVARRGLHTAVAVVRKVLPDDEDTRTDDASPRVSTEPVHQPPSPNTTTKKATTN